MRETPSASEFFFSDHASLFSISKNLLYKKMVDALHKSGRSNFLVHGCKNGLYGAVLPATLKMISDRGFKIISQEETKFNNGTEPYHLVILAKRNLQYLLVSFIKNREVSWALLGPETTRPKFYEDNLYFLSQLQPLEHVVVPEPDQVVVNFCYAEADGSPRVYSRPLTAPEWPEVRENYPKNVVSDIDLILGRAKPWNHGKLLIWSGPTGTGKTYALRALMKSWSNKFQFTVIKDPEKLLSMPFYYERLSAEFDVFDIEQKADDTHKRNLIILEDCGMFVAEQSRKDPKMGLSRLLNLTDGLMGQTIEDVFLVTFNERIEDIDGAFTRPGRCQKATYFGMLSPEEAKAWLLRRGISDVDIKEDTSLATLYNVVAERNEQ